ncbi:hypothetical protein HU200_006583 [Digitaria exilis]|uniref:PPC domain-containing protein n=1 Tax=Digitaria exilis TaxID=1010633 RepID=A0A835FP28_9POAL|nr:hypothetical protein HU200_006583 [Digitaria exilis]
MDREGLYRGGEGRLVVQGFLPPPPQQHGHHMECFSDEANSSRDGEEEASAAANNGTAGPPAAATTVEVVGKRRRGRPPGSKNKPKPPPPVVTQDVEPAAAMRPHVLEVPAGADVARALAGFARRCGLGICVLAGTGAVADVLLRHPSSSSTSSPAPVVFRGRYEIVSISATFLAPSMAAAVPRAAVRDLSVSLAGPHGQIVGGAVAGPLVAATTVVVLAAAFTDVTFHRLPLEDDASAAASVSGSAEADGHLPRPEPQDASGLHPHNMHSSMAPATTQAVALYGRQAQEVWPPTTASAQRPRPPYQ